MTKAIILLKALLEERKLKSFCETFELSYKYCHAVMSEKKYPSYNLIDTLKNTIPVEYWFEEADKAFVDNIQSQL